MHVFKALCIGPLVALASLGGAGCRGSDGGAADAGPRADGGADDDTIYLVQDGTFADGDAVTLSGVVVVAIDTFAANSTGSLWVAEPLDHPQYGRAYSGVQVFLRGTEAADLAVGDLVNVAGGVVDEFRFDCEREGVDCSDTLQTLTEISAPQNGAIMVTKVGTAEVPVPVTLLPQDLAADATKAEEYESVLIRFENVAALNGPSMIGTTPDFQSLDVTGPFEVINELAAFPDGLARSDCFSEISGIGSYFFDYRIMPRSAADFGPAGAGCPAAEAGAEACADGLDNDFNGFDDCADFGCQNSAPELCQASVSVVAVQDGTIAAGSTVALSGVVVTAVSEETRDAMGGVIAPRGRRLWIQDADSSADYNGVVVFRGNAAPAVAADVQVGSVVNVTGRAQEFNDETQIVVSADVNDVEFVANTGTAVVRAEVPLATLGDEGAAGEPYEGMLVEVRNVAVVSPNDSFGGFTVGAGADLLTVDDVVFPDLEQPAAAGTCYARVRGVMGYAFADRKVYPRSVDDLELGGTCD